MKLKISAEFWAILFLFIMGLLVRAYHLGGLKLGVEEILSAIRINRSLLDTFELIRHEEFPPLYYGILNLWAHAFGNGAWVLRLPSVIFSGLTIIVIYKLGAELFSKSVGFISASLLIFSPFAVFYAQFVKVYALFWFLVAWAFLFFFRFLKDQSKHAYMFYIITSILCCYTMYTGFLFLVTQSMIFLLIGQPARRRKWFTGQMIIVSFCIPWGVYFLCSKHADWGLSPPSATADYFKFFLETFLTIIGGCLGGLGKINCFLYVFLIVFLLIDIWECFYKNKKIGCALPANYYGLFIWIIIPAIIYFLLECFFFPVDLHARYIGFIQIPIILLVSSQMNKFHGVIKKILFLVLIVIAMNNTYLYFQHNLKHTDEKPRIAEALVHGMGEHDIVLSFIPISLFKTYYNADKVDTSRFFEISNKDFSSGSLVKKGILTGHVHSIFFLYMARMPSEIQLDGFSSDYRVSGGGIGFLHFRRTHEPRI